MNYCFIFSNLLEKSGMGLKNLLNVALVLHSCGVGNKKLLSTDKTQVNAPTNRLHYQSDVFEQ